MTERSASLLLRDIVDPIILIQNLLALTQQENLDEARNAALAAARLILKHKITLVPPPASLGVSFPEPPKMQIRPEKGKSAPQPSPGWKAIKSKYDGNCKWCRKSIKKDTRIFWHAQEGAYHPQCFKEFES